MIKYGLDRITELKFRSFMPHVERRDEQWIDIVLQPELAEATPVPDDVIDFTILVICTHDGTIVQMVPQDEDCDCEYGFTVGEKEQIAAYVASDVMQREIAKVAAP
ncbi:hypothetical protein M6D81_05560 [Paenibacillus sp. J5C_2022]|uniref:hypothetical protein n=1 Tax=Paenibacillus sp. J5C2022 TaxID=2977129 RepID=UPI0021CF7088|nr:hypothetical protein [Paenibacillus sp. J5C2022]MCU6708173.1 hypothetical protein [Paenibacillus sp. J5C2022]